MTGTAGGARQANVLTTRARNRALLARQLLLEPAALPVLEAVRRLYALQAQSPTAPYFALRARLHGFRPEQLAELLLNRSVIRMALMRSTVHLVEAEDGLALRPLLQPAVERGFWTTYGRFIEGIDPEALATAGRTLFEERPRTLAEVAAELDARWPGRNRDAVAAAVRVLLPLVQPPPRGIWGAGGPALHTPIESWLARPLDPAPSREEMVPRYLAAFGPASVRDAQTWTGLTRLKPIFDGLRPRLVTFRDEAGRELFDLPEAPRPDPATPAPVRFLGEFDNILLAHADKTRVMAAEHKRHVFTVNGIIKSVVLVDGFVAAIWRLERTREQTTLVVDPLARIADVTRAEIEAEAARVLAFASPGEPYAIELRPFTEPS